MSIWTPEWKVSANGTEVTDVTVANLTITSGRTNVNVQAQAGYCYLQLINLNNTAWTYNVNTPISISLKDSSGNYVPIFGGTITDLEVTVDRAGSVGYTTRYTITAVGALSKIQRVITEGVLTQDYEGNQIYSLLEDVLYAQWKDVSASQTWANVDPAEQWLDAANIGIGDIDQPGNYLMVNRGASNTNLYTLISDIATSANGYIYEDANGNISYADDDHRANYQATYGFTELDANNALWNGIATNTQIGNIRNKYILNYGNSFNDQYVYENTTSQAAYGIYTQEANSYIKNAADAQTIAQKYVALRDDPYAYFQSITFQLANDEIDDTDRDALINVFMGLPVQLKNLPANIAGGTFNGYVEGWTFRASYNALNLTINASPMEFSQPTLRWNQAGTTIWNNVLGTITWTNATGALT